MESKMVRKLGVLPALAIGAMVLAACGGEAQPVATSIVASTATTTGMGLTTPLVAETSTVGASETPGMMGTPGTVETETPGMMGTGTPGAMMTPEMTGTGTPDAMYIDGGSFKLRVPADKAERLTKELTGR